MTTRDGELREAIVLTRVLRGRLKICVIHDRGSRLTPYSLESILHRLDVPLRFFGDVGEPGISDADRQRWPFLN